MHPPIPDLFFGRAEQQIRTDGRTEDRHHCLQPDRMMQSQHAGDAAHGSPPDPGADDLDRGLDGPAMEPSSPPTSDSGAVVVAPSPPPQSCMAVPPAEPDGHRGPCPQPILGTRPGIRGHGGQIILMPAEQSPGPVVPTRMPCHDRFVQTAVERGGDSRRADHPCVEPHIPMEHGRGLNCRWSDGRPDQTRISMETSCIYTTAKWSTT